MAPAFSPAHRSFHRLPLALGALLAVAMGTIAAAPASAADLVVGTDCGPAIQACIDAAAAGDRVVVPGGEWNESLVLDRAVSILGAGTDPAPVGTVIRPFSGRALLVIGTAVTEAVSVSSLGFEGGSLGGNVCPASCGGAIAVVEGAGITLEAVRIQGNTAYRGGGLFTDEGTRVTVIDSSFVENVSVLSGGAAELLDEADFARTLFQDNRSDFNVGGALRIAGATVIVDSAFLGNTANCQSPFGICHGGALYAFEADVTVTGSRFEDNACNDPFDQRCDGGAVYFASSFVDVTLSLVDTDFTRNSASRSGGAVSAGFDRAAIVVDGGEFVDNVAGTGDGGGLAANRAELSGVRFVRNVAENGTSSGFPLSGRGGGAYVRVEATIEQGVFEGNRADYGGGLALDFAVAAPRIVDGVFTGNRAARDGGGLWRASSLDVLTLDGSRFSGNRSGGDGGGVWTRGGLSAAGAEIRDNEALQGGGAFVDTGDVSLVAGTFDGNAAAGTPFGGGGGLFVRAANLTADGTVFTGNGTGRIGGGAEVQGDASLTGVRFENNTAGFAVGGLAVHGSLQARATSFAGNVAPNIGGAFVDAGVDLVGVSFRSNRATAGSGGGLSNGFATDDPVAIRQSEFSGNEAALSGGGASLSGEMTLEDVVFEDNRSLAGGGLSAFVGFELATLRRVQLVENVSTGNGGGANVFGNSEWIASRVAGNTSLEGEGGGIHAGGSLVTLTDSILDGNRALLDGGGLRAGTVRIDGGAVSGNTSLQGDGGGLYLQSFFAAEALELSGNSAPLGNGGGAYVRVDLQPSILVRVVGNVAGGDGGGLWVGRDAALGAFLVQDNQAGGSGGGLYSTQTFGTPDLYVDATTFAGNVAGDSGGGMAIVTNDPSRLPRWRLENSTLSGNQSTSGGSALDATGIGELVNVTLFDGLATGPALAWFGETSADPAEQLSLLNTLIAGSCANTGTVASAGGNLESPGDSCGLGAADQVAVAAFDLGLDPVLADNGGPTPTHALLDGSTAIDAGVNVGCPAVDQRGLPRNDGACDVGAFEDAVIEVMIDVLPGSDDNPVRTAGGGVLPVAILTTAIAAGDGFDFDAATVDPSSLRFGPGEATLRHAAGHLEDVDGDGDVDLLLHFERSELDFQCGDSEGVLTGATRRGEAIRGVDAVWLLGCDA